MIKNNRYTDGDKKNDGNLVYNPSFEKVTNPGLADGQNFSFPSPQKADPGATVFTDSRLSMDGKFSLRVTTPTSGGGKRVNLIPIILKSGNTYSGSFWAKSSNQEIPPRFKFSIEAVKQEKVFKLSNQWKKYSFYVKSDTTTTNAIVQLELLDKGVVWLDLIELAADPSMEYEINDDQTATVFIRSSLKNVVIKYSDGTKRLTTYKHPFKIKQAGKIRAIVLEKKDTLAESDIFIPVNKALGKSVIFETRYNSSYEAQGDSSLTNAVMGTTSFKDGNWLGFLDSTVVFTIDMEQKTEINNVTLNLLCDPNSGIFLPVKMSVYTSDTGKDFQLCGAKTSNLISERGEPYLVPFDISCNKITSRYIRVVINTFGKIPEGYLFKGTNSWMFIDEVLVQ